MFTTNGELYYPATVGEFYDPGEIDANRATVQAVTGVSEVPPIIPPTVLPEFFGDVILVNGKAWPKLEVEPRKYRFRLLNGSDSRFYRFNFSNGMTFYQIGTDDGLLPSPVPLTQLLMGPGERADVVVDFNGQQGTDIILENTGSDGPFDGTNFNSDTTRPTGQIMKFVVNQPLSDAADPDWTTLPTLRGAIPFPAESDSVRTRKLALFEGLDEFGRLQPLLGVAEPTLAVDGNTYNGSQTWAEEGMNGQTIYPITENPMLNDIEIWEIYNATADAHPIHLHLVSFEILGRQDFTADVIEQLLDQHDGSKGVGARLENIQLIGTEALPAANERGWKDMVVSYPGQVTRIIAKFDRPGRYVWHCHILSHEDHEMMRPYYIGSMPPA